MNPLAEVLIAYIVIVAVLALAQSIAAAIGKSRLWLPFQVERTDAGQLSADEARFVEERERELAPLGFVRVDVSRSRSGPYPLVIATWLDSTRTIHAIAQAMQTTGRWQVRYLSLTSFEAGGSSVTTRNFPGVPVYRNPPGLMVYEVPHATAAEDLVAQHRATIARAELTPLTLSPAEANERIAALYRYYCEYQEEQGLVRRDDARGRWVGKPVARLRYLLFQVVPLPTDLDPARLAIGVFLGASVPFIIVAMSAAAAAHSVAMMIAGLSAGILVPARPWPWAILFAGAALSVSPAGEGGALGATLFVATMSAHLVRNTIVGLVKPGPSVWTVAVWLALLLLVFLATYSVFSLRR